MKLSKEQIAALEHKLSFPWGSASLMCDGYRIDLQVFRFKALSFRIMTYVNGTFDGAWYSPSTPCPEQKFLRKIQKPIAPRALRAKAEKELGKRYVARDPYYQKKITVFWPDWASGKAAISHLCRVCESVEVLE